MAREVPLIDLEECARVAETLRRWGKLHPIPDDPVIQLGDGMEITPRDISEALTEVSSVTLESGPRTAIVIWKLFSVSVNTSSESSAFDGGPIEEAQTTLDEVLHDFKRDIDLWNGELSLQ